MCSGYAAGCVRVPRSFVKARVCTFSQQGWTDALRGAPQFLPGGSPPGPGRAVLAINWRCPSSIDQRLGVDAWSPSGTERTQPSASWPASRRSTRGTRSSDCSLARSLPEPAAVRPPIQRAASPHARLLAVSLPQQGGAVAGLGHSHGGQPSLATVVPHGSRASHCSSRTCGAPALRVSAA